MQKLIKPPREWNDIQLSRSIVPSVNFSSIEWFLIKGGNNLHLKLNVTLVLVLFLNDRIYSILCCTKFATCRSEIPDQKHLQPGNAL